MASGTFGQLIASVFSYFRDKSWFLRWRGGEKRTDMDDELQDILLRLGGVTSWDQLREAVRDAVGITLQNTEDLVVYLSDIATGTLVSQDGLAGVVHTLPKSGLAGKCAEEQHLIVAKALDIEDPLCGLLPSASPTLPENRTVACIPVLGSDNARLVGIIAVVCDAVSSNQEKRLSLVGRHIAVCVQRLHQMATQQRLPPASTTTPTACSGSPDGGTCMGSSYDNGILQLCAELHDNDPASMQTKVVKYLERHTQSECCALWIVSSEDATEVFCQVLGNRVLEEEIRILIPLSCFNTVVTEERSITLDDISENSRTELEQKMDMKIKSLLCVPVINQARSKVVAVACCINKIGAPRFGQADEDVVRHCFRYTVPVLTSVMSLQKERQLKQETQSMLQVAKNLFTHLGRLHDDVTTWSKCLPNPCPFVSMLVSYPSGSLDDHNWGIIRDEKVRPDWLVGSDSLTEQIAAQEAKANRVIGQSPSRERLAAERRRYRPIKPAPYPTQPTAEDRQRRRGSRLSPPPRHTLIQLQGQKRKLSELEASPTEESSSEVLAKMEEDTLSALGELGHLGHSPAPAGSLRPQDDSELPTCDPTPLGSSSSSSLEQEEFSPGWDQHLGTQEKAKDFQAANDEADLKLLQASLQKLGQSPPKEDDTMADPLLIPESAPSAEMVQHVHFSKESSTSDVPGGTDGSQPSSPDVTTPSILIKHESPKGGANLRSCGQSASAHRGDWETVEVDSQSGAGLPSRQGSVLELDWSPGTLSVHYIDQPPSLLLQETCMYKLFIWGLVYLSF